MKILLTGKNGQVGWELQRTLCTLGEVTALGSAELDLADADAIVRIVRDLKPDLIVNPAAYTAVDKAESEPELAMAVNGRAPGILAEEAKRIGAALVHFSTDYVFDGSSSQPYVETDTPAPLNVYGSSKLAGERAIQAVDLPHCILRTSWVYGARGRNFVLTMRRLMRERDELRVVADQIGAPSWSRWLAQATAQLLATRAVRELPSGADGIFNLTPAGAVSWQGFAQEIARHTGATARVLPIASAEYPTPARRPLNSRLCGSKLEREFGICRDDWRKGLAFCLDEMAHEQ